MDPMWTREVKLSQRKLDPLGLSRVSQWLTEELLPGITTVTSIARNYSFYCWGISNLLNMNKIIHRNQFAQEITKREAAFVIGCILHEANKTNKLNPHGYEKATRFIKKDSNEKIQVAFNVSESNPEGFYGLYYRTAMFKLGLTIRSRLFDDLTPLGRQLAAAFESNIKDTEYFKHHIKADDIDKKILAEYGEKACICKLVTPSNERELLKSIMFSDNLPSLNLKSSRKDTLLLVLSLIKQSSDFGIEFTEDTFREAIFFGQATGGKVTFDFNFKNFEEITARWHLFQLHEYFTFAMESLLHALLNELKKKDEGMSFDEFLSFVDKEKPVSEALKISSTGSIKEIINLLLKNLQLSELKSDTSRQFDRLCNLEKETSEKKLPFIPTERELDDLISGTGKKLSTFLQLLKETAMRCGEAKRLKWTDIDFEKSIIKLNEPEKGSNPRMWKVSQKLIAMLNALPRNSQKVFGDGPINSIKTTFLKARKSLAAKLQNPRLLSISFHTFRHWKATMLYHQTKDPYYVKQFLGHKELRNTEIYINIERTMFEPGSDEFTVKVAEKPEEIKALLEVGFEYVCQKEGLIFLRKRK